METEIKYNQKLTDKIMMRVNFIHLARKILLPLMGKGMAFVCAIAILAFSVSVKNIFSNMPSMLDLPSIARFGTVAFTNTEIHVKLIFLSAFVFALLFL